MLIFARMSPYGQGCLNITNNEIEHAAILKYKYQLLNLCKKTENDEQAKDRNIEKKSNAHQIDVKAARMEQQRTKDELTIKAMSSKFPNHNIRQADKTFTHAEEIPTGIVYQQKEGKIGALELPDAVSLMLIDLAISCFKIAYHVYSYYRKKRKDCADDQLKSVDEKNTKNLRNKTDARTEGTGGADIQQGGLTNTEKKQKQENLPSVNLSTLGGASHKQHEKQKYQTEISKSSILTNFSSLLPYILDSDATLLSREYYVDPKMASVDKQEDMIQESGEDRQSSRDGESQEDLHTHDSVSHWHLSSKGNAQDHERLTKVWIPEKLCRVFQGEMEQRGTHERIVDTPQRDLQSLEEEWTIPLSQAALDGDKTLAGTTLNQETANTGNEEMFSSNEHMLPRDESSHQQSSGSPIELRETTRLNDHLDGLHDLTTVKTPAHTSYTETESLERLQSECQSETDGVCEMTHETEAGAALDPCSSDSLMEDGASISDQNHQEITHEVESEGSRPNLPETTQGDLQEPSLESSSGMAQRPEVEVFSHTVLKREQRRVSDVSSESLREVYLQCDDAQESSVFPPEFVRVNTPVTISSLASPDSLYYDGHFTPPSGSVTHWPQASSPLTGSVNLTAQSHTLSGLAHHHDALVSDGGLAGPSEQWNFHIPQPESHRATQDHGFSAQSSVTQSQRERLSYSVPQHPVDECSGHTPTESQVLLSIQVQEIHDGFTPELPAPSTVTPSNEARGQDDSAPIRLPPITVHAASAIPPWATQTALIDLSQAANRQFVPLRRRRGTYDDDWPDYSDIDPTNMALAGFYCLGCARRPGRHVRCFYCGLELHALTTADNIWDEHVRRHPTCAYLRAIMGDDLILKTQTNLKKQQK